MKTPSLFLALILVAGCASTAPYGPASRDGAMGYSSQVIETGRHRISYTDKDAGRARDLALLRAAEITLQDGKDWFEITSSYTEDESVRGRSGGGTSVSVGGSSGSYGSGVGVGVGIALPLGGSSAPVTEVLEIVTGSGPKPDRPTVYDARSVDINLRSSVVG